MLILTRAPSQEIKINDDITIKVLEIRGKQVRLGFSAPQSVKIHRSEYLRKKESK